MKDKKKIVIGTLCALIMLMAVGYALLSQQLSINGTANITSTWKIEITNITEKERHGGVTEKSKSYDAMTANFNVGFTSPGDYIIYEVEVTNSGTLDAVIERINVVTNNNPAIIYTTSGIKKGTTIESNTKKYLTVKIEYDSNITSQPQTNNNALTIQLFTAQNLGQVQPDYDYVIGDLVEFAGSNWYVIKNSTEDEDYVTLLKEKILTDTELGDYKIRATGVKFSNSSNDYSTSLMKEFLEGTYINTLGSDNLKSVGLNNTSYKIRLITLEELTNHLGYEQTPGSAGQVSWRAGAATPTWVYQNYGHNNGYTLNGYWTMIPYSGSNSDLLIFSYGSLSLTRVDYGYLMYGEGFAVRPVINLYKSAIE